MRDENLKRLCFVLSCIALYSSRTKTCTPFCSIKGLLNGLLVKQSLYIFELICRNGSQYMSQMSVISG